MSLEKDRAFFRNFSIVVIILAAMMVVFLVAAIIVGGAVSYGDSEARVAKVSERTAPVGEVRMEGEAAVADAGAADAGEQVAAANDEPMSGKQVYDKTCAACHGGALPGAPALGDAEAWAPRLEQGVETVYKHAIEGFQGEGGLMPAKGGNMSLSDDEVKAAVDYMVENSQ